MKEALQPDSSGTRPSQDAMATCPMAKMCMGMMKKGPPGFLLLLPGVLLIGVGILVVIEPRILVWLMAAAFIFLGCMMLMMAGFIRKMGARLPMQ